jgi:intracellular multiplication protein IcmP
MAGGQKNPNDDMLLGALIIIVLAMVTWAIWATFKNELKSGFRWVRYYELKIVRMVIDDNYAIRDPRYGVQSAKAWEAALPTIRPQDLNLPAAQITTQLAVLPLKNFFITVMLLMAIWVYWRGPNTQYRRRFTLEFLIKEQAKVFKTISPFVKFNPLKLKARIPGDPVPQNLPLFAEALSPEEWVAYHDIRFQNKKLDFNKAYQALYQQLGRRWQGPLKLPIHAQGIYAACALKHIRKRKECDDLLDELAMAWSEQKGFRPPLKLRRKIKAIIKDPKIGGKLKPYIDRHGYETTAMLRALQRAREEGGILASAQFVWLRGHDRTLWYPLNNLGRKSYHAEAAGALGHYVHELIAGQKIPMPRFDEVIKVIEQFLISPGAREIPKLLAKTKAK